MKQFRASPRLWPILLFALTCLAAGPARAACTSPTGAEKDFIYNGDYHTYQFCNGTSWIPFGGGGPGSGPMSLISTQTASASASLQFTNLPTSYNYFKLFCNLVPSVATASASLQFGEGAGPTWETGANYEYEEFWSVQGSTGRFSTASATYFLMGGGASGAGGDSFLFEALLSNLASTTLYKQIIQDAVGPGGTYGETFVSGKYIGDTNAVTGLQIVPSTGTIASGSCSLYGMN